jgi:hypothetical protein
MAEGAKRIAAVSIDRFSFCISELKIELYRPEWQERDYWNSIGLELPTYPAQLTP